MLTAFQLIGCAGDRGQYLNYIYIIILYIIIYNVYWDINCFL